MVSKPRLSTPDGANQFWERHGVTIRENDSIYYATIKGGAQGHFILDSGNEFVGL